MSIPSLRVQYLDKRFRVKLGEKPLSIGRLKENRLCIEIGSISRRHAVIEYDGTSWTVKDLGSSNGIVSQGRQVKILKLQKDVEFSLGDARFTPLIDAQEGDGDDSTATKVIESGTENISTACAASPAKEINLRATQESTLTAVQQDNAICIGSEVCGYRIDRQLQRDSLQSSYQAHQLSIDRTVVLKVLNSAHTGNPAFVKKFTQQAKVSGSYNHPNIVHTLDCNEVDGLFFYTVEWIGGATLTKLLKREQRLSIRQSLDIITDIAQALSYIHQKGATHQNIKPNSIIIKENGEAKLSDVGLFALFDSDGTQESRKLIGSPHYMSPEQARGRQLSDRSDVYSLGTVLYHMVTNRPPFEGDNPVTIISKQIKQLPRAPKSFDITIDDQLDNLIMEMLQKDPKMRPSIDKVVALLPDIQSGATPVESSEEGSSVQVRKRRKRMRRLRRGAPRSSTLLSVVLAAVVGVIALAMLGPKQREFALEKAPWTQKIFSIIDDIKAKRAEGGVKLPTRLITGESFETGRLTPLAEQRDRLDLTQWVEDMGEWQGSTDNIHQDDVGGGTLIAKEEMSLASCHLTLQIKALLYPLSIKFGPDCRIILRNSELKFNITTPVGDDVRNIPLKLKSDTPIRLEIICENGSFELGLNGTRIYRGVVAGLNEVSAKPEIVFSGTADIQRLAF